MPHHVVRRLVLIGLMVVVAALITVINPVFMTSGNLLKLLQEAAQTGIIAVGFTFVMITAGIDMSIGGVVAVTSMVCINFLHFTQVPVPILAAISLLVGATTGFVNGWFITKYKQIGRASCRERV